MWGIHWSWKSLRNAGIILLVFSLFITPLLFDKEDVVFTATIIVLLFVLIGVTILFVASYLKWKEEETPIFEEEKQLFLKNISTDEEDICDSLDIYPDLYDKFQYLKELYEDDLITEEEYSEKKKQLLGKL